MDVANLGFKVDTRGLVAAKTELKNLNIEALKAAKAADFVGFKLEAAGKKTGLFGQAAQRLGGVVAKSGRQVQNAAFQVGDFAVQVASGQAASRALAQQLPQLLGGFGIMGAVLGAVVAVGAALVPVFFNLADGAEDMSDAMESLDDIISGLEDSLDANEQAIDSLRLKYGQAAERVREFNRAQAQLRMIEAEEALRQQVGTLEDLTREYATVIDLGRGAFKNLIALGEDFGVTRREAEALSAAFREFQGATTFEDQQDAANNLLRVLEEQNVSLDQMPPEIRRALSEMLEYSNQADRARQIMDELAASTGQIGMTFGNPRALAGLSGEALLPSPGDRGIDTDNGRSGGRGMSEAEKERRKAMREAEQIIESVRTKTQQFAVEQARLNELLKQGYIDQSVYNLALEDLEQKYLGVGDAAAYFRDVQDEAKDVILDSLVGIGDLRSGFADLAQQIARAAFQAALFGEGPLNNLFGQDPQGGGILGSLFGGGGGGGGLAGIISGFFASGTPSAPGGLAVVGERGPELVNLPKGSEVTPAGRTADLMRGAAEPVVNVKNINVLDPALVGDFLATPAGEKAIMNVVSRNERG